MSNPIYKNNVSHCGPSGYIVYVKAALEQNLLSPASCLVPADAIFSEHSPHKLYRHVRPKRIREDLEDLTTFYRLAERYANRALQGEHDYLNRIRLMANTLIAYLDKVSAARPEMAMVHAFDALTWPVRLPSDKTQQQIAIGRLTNSLMLGQHWHGQKLTVPQTRLGAFGYLLGKYMCLLKEASLKVDGLAHVKECRALPPLQGDNVKENLNAWWRVGASIISANYKELAKLADHEVTAMRHYYEIEARLRGAFIERIGRHFKRWAFTIIMEGHLAQQMSVPFSAAEKIETTQKGSMSIGQISMPEMLWEPESPLFVTEDLVDFESLVKKLVFPPAQPLLWYLVENFNPILRKKLQLYLSLNAVQREEQKEKIDVLKQKVLVALNIYVKGELLYTPERFAGIQLQESTRSMLEHVQNQMVVAEFRKQNEKVNVSGENKREVKARERKRKKELAELNRMLLADALPSELLY